MEAHADGRDGQCEAAPCRNRVAPVRAGRELRGQGVGGMGVGGGALLDGDQANDDDDSEEGEGT